MAGGCGTRISELFPDIPKPLIRIRNRNEIEIRKIYIWNQELLYIAI